MEIVKNSSENQSTDLILQELRLLKMKLSTLENSNEHLKDDNELLLKQKEDAMDSLIKEREEHKNKIGKLNLELIELQENFSSYKEDVEKQIQSLKVTNTKPDVPKREENNDFFTASLEEYRKEIEDLNLELQTCKEKEVNINRSLHQLEENNNLLKIELEETKGLLASKAQQLKELSDSNEELKEEKLLLSTELAALKSAPSDVNNRGNSLFGEVEDRRQVMSSKLKILYNKYIMLKKNYLRKNSDFDRLKAELNLLQTKWINFMEGGPKADDRLIAAQNSRIKDLMERNAELEKRPEEPHFVTVDERNLSWALGYIEKARSEGTNLRRELDRYSFNQYAVEQALRNKTGEALRLNEEVLKLKAENVKLQLAQETEKETDSTASVMNDEKINDEEINKENRPTNLISTDKRVKFKE